MKEIVCTEMVIERNGKPVTVDIDGFVFYDVTHLYRGQSESVRAQKTISVTGVVDVDATAQEIELIGDIKLTDEEEEKASERLIYKFLKG
jgi:hypothetical protein